MDTLFSANPGAFAQMATHISVYHQPMSDGFRALCDDVFRQTVGLWRFHRYTFWNVPGLGAMLGRSVPLDVHGWHTVLDEQELLLESRRMRYSTLRYAMLIAGQRRKEGGRKVYDYVTMNGAIAAGTAMGATWILKGRQRWTFFDRRPVRSILAGGVIAGVGFLAVRFGLRSLGVGLWIAERSHAKALHHVTCADCLDELIEFTGEQLEDLKTAKLPDPMPGQPPMPPEMHAKFKENLVTQGKLLRTDQREMRALQRHVLKSAGVEGFELTKAERKAERMRRLGMSPEEAKQIEEQRELGPEGVLAKRRQEREEKRRAAAVATSPPAALSTSSAATSVEEDVREAKSKETIALAEQALSQILSEEGASAAARESAVMRPLPASCLCEVHQGLRQDPEKYQHPRAWPIFALDRQKAALRVEAIRAMEALPPPPLSA